MQIEHLPRERISRRILDSLPEYSISVPTGQTIGKVWKCRVDPWDESQGWLIREYVPCDEPGMIGIDTRLAEVVE